MTVITKIAKKFWLTLPSQNASLAILQSAMLTTWLSLLFPFGTSYIIFTTTSSDTVMEDFKNYSFYARKLEQQGRACTLATRLFDHSPNSNRPRGLSDCVNGPTAPHCCAAVQISCMDGPTTPLLRICSNRPRGWTDHVATRVPLHDLASCGPSAPNRTDRQANNTGWACKVRS